MKQFSTTTVLKSESVYILPQQFAQIAGESLNGDKWSRFDSYSDLNQKERFICWFIQWKNHSSNSWLRVTPVVSYKWMSWWNCKLHWMVHHRNEYYWILDENLRRAYYMLFKCPIFFWRNYSKVDQYFSYILTSYWT